MTGCATPLPICPDPSLLQVRQEIPSGLNNCLNLTYTTANSFIAGTLEVFLDGRLLDSGLDFTESGTLNGFTVILDTTDKNRLQTAFRHNESLRVNYTMSVDADSSCITVL